MQSNTEPKGPNFSLPKIAAHDEGPYPTRSALAGFSLCFKLPWIRIPFYYLSCKSSQANFCFFLFPMLLECLRARSHYFQSLSIFLLSSCLAESIKCNRETHGNDTPVSPKKSGRARLLERTFPIGRLEKKPYKRDT